MKCILLLSGGIDSATALYHALSKGYDVEAITFDYEVGQEAELRAAKQVAGRAGVKHSIIHLDFYKKLQGSPSSMQEKMIDDTKVGVSNAYVPARNIVFFGMAAAVCEVTGAELIITGHNRQDSTRFPDVNERFVKLFNEVIALGLKNEPLRPRVQMPLKKMDKFQVLRRAIELRVPLELTWSCYNSGETPCGICYGCISRKEAFDRLGMADPWTSSM